MSLKIVNHKFCGYVFKFKMKPFILFFFLHNEISVCIKQGCIGLKFQSKKKKKLQKTKQTTNK